MKTWNATATTLVEILLNLWTKEEEFRRLFGEQEYFCLPHAKLLIGARRRPACRRKRRPPSARRCAAFLSPTWQTVESDVTHFCRMFDYRNKDGDWGNSKDAIERAIAYLYGPALYAGGKRGGKGLTTWPQPFDLAATLHTAASASAGSATRTARFPVWQAGAC